MNSSTQMPRYIDGESMAGDITGEWINCRGLVNLGFQIIWAAAGERTIPVTAAATVTTVGNAWEFPGADFNAGDVGGAFVISGTDLGNDGTYTVATVVDAENITTVEAPAAIETFDGTETASMEPLEPTGSWGAEVSYDGPVKNDEGREQPSGNLGATPLELDSSFTDQDPSADEGNTEFEFRGMPAPWFRLTYTATTGGGILKVGAAGKGF
jgi:hypothetical protein